MLEPTKKKSAAAAGTTKKSEGQDISTDVVKVLFATCDKPAATADTNNATDTVSNCQEQRWIRITTGTTPLVKSQVCNRRG
jgi:hypothetical protein